MDSLLIASSWIDPAWWWAVAQVCLGLGFVIFVHELGHFLVAKACGVKCEKFYVGFDFFDIKIGDLVLIPRSLVKFQWGETEYGVGILPLGGYVKMLGQDDNPGNMEKEIERSRAANADESDGSPSASVLDRGKIDPRSFLAKSVPQRMAIISAGVIFNLIFAVIFAAIAFKSGVNYDPPVVGNVVPGGPAWEANLYGASFKRIGESKVEGFYRFEDMSQAIALDESGDGLEVEYTMPGSETVQTATVTPRAGVSPVVDIPMLGIERAMEPSVSADPVESYPDHPAASAKPPFAVNDRIVAINEKPIENIFDLQRELAANFDKPVIYRVERKKDDEAKPEEIDVSVGTNPRREYGLAMKWGPVVSIQQDSPATAAGLEKGDQVTAIDGEQPGSLYTLEQRMTRVARDQERPVAVTVLRDGEEIEIEIEPRQPEAFGFIAPGQPVAVNSLGLAIEPTNVVESSTINGIAKGDTITRVQFVTDNEQRERQFANFAQRPDVDLTEDNVDWSIVESLLQRLPVGFKFKLFADSDSSKKDEPAAVAQTFAAPDHFLPTRGIPIAPFKKFYQSKTWQDAFKVGARQTWWDATRIFKFLGKLVRGQISPKNLGGPGLIAAAATSEATQGTSRLLLFLTLLSANLAIVNFLPIPVLDGGHMLFLAYEGLFRQPPNEKIQIILTYAGLFLILGLMLYVILLDINRFSGWF